MDALTAKDAKAVKEYLEKFRMTVPKDIEDLAKGSTDNILPADQKSAFIQYNANLRKPIWYRYCPLFEELWKVYITKYWQTQYTSELRRCVEDASDSLFTAAQNRETRPKLLLGYVHSGKTQTFAFIAARCFDLGFDTCIILTANKKILKKTN